MQSPKTGCRPRDERVVFKTVNFSLFARGWALEQDIRAVLLAFFILGELPWFFIMYFSLIEAVVSSGICRGFRALFKLNGC